MKIFVTGGAGFIGSNYARWVLRNNSDESKKLFAGFYIAKEEEKPEIT
ncbi:MAG: dTDP-glucose 4,6-dehydratase, partial [Actinobacteria bacterium]|nr:dTDP-glucose 4,6-dehydratase [Actinomycetota bacterium]